MSRAGLVHARRSPALALALACLAPHAPALQEAVAPGALDLTRGTHLPLTLERAVSRVAVGDPDVLSFELLDERELLLLGESVGRTSLLVWSGDGPPTRYQVAVEPDLSLLREALAELSPEVRVASALDRDAIVLRGRVPDLATREAVEAAARAWLDAAAETTSPTGLANAVPGALPAEADTAPVGQVISLLLVDELPLALEERIADAVASAGAVEVDVTRVVRGLRPDDAVDAFVLEGRVPDQAALTRALLVAAAALDPDLVDAGIEVVADESGGLRSGNVQQNANQANQPFAATGQGSGVFQGGGGGQANQIDNRIRSNLARAAAVSAAGGRVLSFLRVVELPQVRVDVEIYELDRTRLDQLDVSLEAVASDFGQGALTGLGTPLEASPLVGSVSPTDAQGVLSLIDGAGSAGFQLADSRAAVSATLRALTANGYARSLARPSLTVLSGELAQFQVGGEVPIPTAFATQVGDGAEGVFNGVDFRAFGVRLVARPLVEPDGRITLDLVPEVVRPDTELTTAIRDATGTSPATVGFESRALRTTARVNRGGALVIGGLLQRSEQGSSSGVPGLSRLPLVGWMFGRDSQQSAMSELVIVVAPSQVFEPRPRARVWAHADPLELVLEAHPLHSGSADGGPESAAAAENPGTPAIDGNSGAPGGIPSPTGPTGPSTPEAPTLTETRT